jgi:hypothetical protein
VRAERERQAVNQHVADLLACSAFLALQHLGQPEMQPERREELF